MTEKERMIAGEMYDASDKELRADRAHVQEGLQRIQAIINHKERGEMCKQYFGATGERITVTAGIAFEYGYNIQVGEDFYCNFNCVLLDICPITIGDNCMLAPNVQLYTATHPIDPVERNSGKELGAPITIGDNCWLGGGVIVIPGVTIGDNVVVAAGSVVTKDVPTNAVVAGNPARIVKYVVD